MEDPSEGRFFSHCEETGYPPGEVGEKKGGSGIDHTGPQEVNGEKCRDTATSREGVS